MSDAIQGVIVGGLLGLVGGWISIAVTSRAETKRQLHRLGLEVAMAEWKQHVEHAKEEANRTQQTTETDAPMIYFYCNYKLIEAISSRNLTVERYAEILNESYRVSDQIEAEIKKTRK